MARCWRRMPPGGRPRSRVREKPRRAGVVSKPDRQLIPFDIPRLLLRRWRELAAIGLEVDQRRLVQTIETAHEDRVALYTDKLDDRGADWVRPLRRPQRKGATRRSVVLRALQAQIAARPMQPIDHFEIAVE